MVGGLSLVDVARRVVAEHENGNFAFQAADAFQLAGDGVRERVNAGVARAE